MLMLNSARCWMLAALCLLLSACAPPAPTPPSPAADQFSAERHRMVVEQIQARDVRDPLVLQAMRTAPRHEFVPPQSIAQAYGDHAMPIGYGQTISQPYIVAVMTELAQIKRGDRVLEIGTGSGYQAAILALITDEVYSVEIIPELAASADARLKRLNYNVRVLHADGYHGWAEHAPYDAILVTAAPDHIPPPLIAQLKDGGRMVIPVGPLGSFQTLWRASKRGDTVVTENIMGVIFVPFTRGR